MSIRFIRKACAPVIGAALAMLGNSTAHAAVDVQLDIAGTMDGFVFPFGLADDAPYNATITYDSAAPGTGGVFPLSSFSDSPGGTFEIATVTIENDIVGGTIDRLTFDGSWTDILADYSSRIVLDMSSDFLPAVQLPTLTEFQDGLTGGKLLSASGNGSGFFFVAPLNHTATIQEVGATAVPEPATLSVLVLGGLTVLSRRRR